MRLIAKIGLGLVGTVWVIVAIVSWARGNQSSLGPVGDSLAPIGSVLTGFVLLIAFEQHHADAERAHLDKLANAYASWFPEAWRIITEIIESIDRASKDKDNGLPGLYRAVNNAYLRERELRAVAIPPLMLERNQALAARLKRTHASFPSFGSTEIKSADVERYREFVSSFVIALRDRRDDVEAVFQGAADEISGKRVKVR
jgi:hypothetical protein